MSVECHDGLPAVEFYLDKKQVAATRRYAIKSQIKRLKETHEGQRQLRHAVFGFAGMLMVLVMFDLLPGFNRVQTSGNGAAALKATLLLFGVASLFFLLGWLSQKVMFRNAMMDSAGPVGWNRVELSPDGVLYQFGGTEVRMDWKLISEMDYDDENYRFLMGYVLAVTVPKQAFSSKEACEAFAEYYLLARMPHKCAAMA